MHRVNRRGFLLATGAMPMGLAQATALQTGALDAAGFAPDLADRLDAGMRSGLLRGLHAVLVVRHGRLVLERYWPGADESWGRPLGVVQHGPDTLHDLRSVTKSIVALLYGIALDRGQVPPPEAPLYPLFPQYADLAADPSRAHIAVGHVLSMTMGLAWNENLPYTNPANSEIAMERAPDRFRFILEQPVAYPPGTRWTYSGGATALLGALLARGTGMSLPDFAKQALFDPLGITRFEWAAGADGVHSAASGLRLGARDLAVLCRMLLANGGSNEAQIVPAAWLERAFAPVVPTGDGLQFGLHWYVGQATSPAFGDAPQRWINANGNGGQRLFLMPSAGLCLVVLAGNYNMPGQGAFPMRVWQEIVLANLLRV